jgi:hypothetical protein
MDLLMASFSHPSQGAEPEEPFDSSVDESWLFPFAFWCLRAPF